VLVRLIAPAVLRPPANWRSASELNAIPSPLIAPLVCKDPPVLVRVTDPVASTVPSARLPAVCTAMSPAVASRSAKVSAPFESIVTERPHAVTAPAELRFATPIAPLILMSDVVPPLVAVPSVMPVSPVTARLPPAMTAPVADTAPAVLVRAIAPVASTVPSARSPAVCTATLPAVASTSANVSAPLDPMFTERPFARVTTPVVLRSPTVSVPFWLVSSTAPPLVSELSAMPSLPTIVASSPAVIGPLPLMAPPTLVSRSAPVALACATARLLSLLMVRSPPPAWAVRLPAKARSSITSTEPLALISVVVPPLVRSNRFTNRLPDTDAFPPDWSNPELATPPPVLISVSAPVALPCAMRRSPAVVSVRSPAVA